MVLEMSKEAITRDMTVVDILTLFPGAAGIMTEYELHCFSCPVGGVESLDEARQIHGMDDDLFEALLQDLNEEFQRSPVRLEELTVTVDAAHSIEEIMKNEGKGGEVLRVIVDGSGGFCMEFAKVPEEDDRIFTASSVPHVRVAASALTLRRIGGAVIDFREGRFKLDLPESLCCGHEGEPCVCMKKGV